MTWRTRKWKWRDGRAGARTRMRRSECRCDVRGTSGRKKWDPGGDPGGWDPGRWTYLYLGAFEGDDFDYRNSKNEQDRDY